MNFIMIGLVQYLSQSQKKARRTSVRGIGQTPCSFEYVYVSCFVNISVTFLSQRFGRIVLHRIVSVKDNTVLRYKLLT